MKKRLYLLAAIAAMASITACAPKSEEQTTPQTTIEASQEDTIESAEEEGNSETGETPSEEEAPEQGSEINQGAESTDETLNQLHSAVKKAYGEQYIPSMAYDETMLEEMFGVKKDWYDAYIAEGPMISVHVETFIGIKAKEGKTGDVAAALESYRKSQLESGVQYPMNLPKVEASQVVTHGDYVFFVMLGGADLDAEEQGEDAALQSARDQNQIGIDVINSFFKE